MRIDCDDDPFGAEESLFDHWRYRGRVAAMNDGIATGGTAGDDAAPTAREKLLQTMLESVTDVVLVIAPDNTYSWVSPAVREVLGWDPQAIIGTTAADFLHPDDLADVLAARARAASGKFLTERFRCLQADGSYRWMSGRSREILDDDGKVIGRIAGLRDIHDEVLAEQRLAEAEAHFRMLAENSSDVVAETGPEGTIHWVSPSIEHVLGWSCDEVIGKRLSQFMHPEDRQRLLALRVDLLGTRTDIGTIEARFADRDGRWKWMAVRGKAILNDDGDVVGGIDALRDITLEHESREELRFLATHDQLTELLTRGAFTNHLTSLLTDAGGRVPGVAVLFTDVDGFKPINDRFGHAIGDRVLFDVAQRISSAVRPEDLVARLGGDEIVVALSGIPTAAAAEAVARGIQRAMSVPFAVGDDLLTVTLSIGVALAQVGDDSEAVLRNADRALYQAKAQGRNRTVTHR